MQQRVSRCFATISMDLPGFGTKSRLRQARQPATYAAFLAHLLVEIVFSPHAAVLGGHAAEKKKALASLPEIRALRLSVGRLALREQYSGTVEKAFAPFL